jgi:hypothetical protein
MRDAGNMEGEFSGLKMNSEVPPQAAEPLLDI